MNRSVSLFGSFDGPERHSSQLDRSHIETTSIETCTEVRDERAEQKENRNYKRCIDGLEQRLYIPISIPPLFFSELLTFFPFPFDEALT